MKKRVIIAAVLVSAITLSVSLNLMSKIIKPVVAADDFLFLKIYSSRDFSLESEFVIDRPGYSLTAVDLGGDGRHELVFGAPRGEKPLVKILRADGSVINEFLAYDEKFKGGIGVSDCDIDDDGKSEIVTAPKKGGGPQVRIFDSFGRLKASAGFFAFDKDDRAGIKAACLDIDGDNKDEVAVLGQENGKSIIRIFSDSGNLLREFNVPLTNNLAQLTKTDLGGDGKDEIVLSAGYGEKPIIRLYRADGSLINEFLVYPEAYTGGVASAAGDIDFDQKGEIMVVPQFLGRPHLRIMDGFGQEKLTNKTFIFSENYLGGLAVAAGNFNGDDVLDIAVMPQNIPTGEQNCYKCIDIDISEQRFRYYQDGYLIDDLPTSTGKPSTPTRLGEFTAFSKYDMAYGGAGGLRWAMPYFIGFYTSGGVVNGIHELPFLNGRREGASSLGRAVSHGCVRLGIGPAKEVYNWVEIGQTKVVVHK